MNHVQLLFAHALTPLHAGTGQGVGSIDLPVARERATGIPYVPGSSVKGVLRDQAEERKIDEPKIKSLFGPDHKSAHEHAGAVVVGDARLLLFPVRSLAGTFAYVTSPYILGRFVREAGLAGWQPPAPPAPPGDAGSCRITPESCVVYGSGSEARVYLEDLDLRIESTPELRNWEDRLQDWTGAPVGRRLCLVHDDVMSFLLETATEVTARIRIDDEKKTVVDGALWYEESLPAETVLYSLVQLTPVTHAPAKVDWADLLPLMGVVQLGGKASVGRGLCRLVMGEAYRANA